MNEVDTSVLINYLKNVEDEFSNALNILIENKYPIGINNFIYQEILQGVKSYEAAAELNVRCRTKGVTVRSSIDLLIAQTAIENNIMLLTNDSDFVNMAKVIEELKIFEV